MNLDSQIHNGLSVQIAAVELAQAKHAEILNRVNRQIRTEESPSASGRLAFALAYVARHFAYRLAPRLASRLVL